MSAPSQERRGFQPPIEPLPQGNGEIALQVHGLHFNRLNPAFPTPNRVPFFTSPGVFGYVEPRRVFKPLETRLQQYGYATVTPLFDYVGPYPFGEVAQADIETVIDVVGKI